MDNFEQLVEMAYGLGESAQPITKRKLLELLSSLDEHGAVMMSLTQITKETTRVAPFKSFILPGLKNGKTYFAKVSQVNGVIGFDYAGNVNKQREREGKETDFVPDPSIYNKLTKSVNELDGQLYLYYRPLQSRSEHPPVYVKMNDQERFEIVPKEEVLKYKTPVAPGSGKQQVDAAIEVRKVSFDSIASINVRGQEYKVTDLDHIRKQIFDLVKPQG